MINMIWVTSDSHFNHANILKYEPESRPFVSIPAMNEEIIKRWNSVVGKEDTVIHCGDFFMGQLTSIDEILGRLNGHIILVRGNHDTPARIQKYKEHGIDVRDIYYLKYKGRFFIFCHFPLFNEEFFRMVREDNSEVILCYGHVHHNAPKGYKDGAYHVGVDTNDLTPVSLDQIWDESWPDEAHSETVVREYKKFYTSPETTRCDKCVHNSWTCGEDPRDCHSYRRDPPDGGYYG